jgi:outer membrane murein-binding lipoprotein Lpp
MYGVNRGGVGRVTARTLLVTASLCAALFLAGCSSIYYSVWEKLGKEKRDLLRDHIESARADQVATAKQFQSALDRLIEVYGAPGGRLQDTYEKVRGDYERSEDRASTLRGRIETVESIGADLFREWKREVGEIESLDLRRRSEAKLRETQARFDRMRDQMRRALDATRPVLAKLKDQSLFLKHSLNTQVVGRLESTEVPAIERELDLLKSEIDRATRAADEFIGELDR